GFEMTLSQQLPQVIREHLSPWLSAWLRIHGLSIADISAWAIHPGGPKILTAAGESLGLAPADLAVSTRVLAEHGNMSSATVLFVLQEILKGEPSPGLCVAIGFGPGLMAEGMLLEI